MLTFPTGDFCRNRHVCGESRDYGLTKIEADEVLSFLKVRRNGLHDLLKSHRAEFVGITDWPTGWME